MRPCVCAGRFIGDKGISTGQGFWPAVRRNAAIGESLLPSIIKRNVDRISKGTLPTLQIVEAGRYILKDLRR